MKNIVRFMKGHGLMMLVIVVLLIVEAYSELSLPNYTGDLINVGLQQGGISDCVPEKIRSESLEMLIAGLEDASYVRDSYKKVNDHLELKSGVNREKLADILRKPEAYAYMLKMYDQSSSESSQGTTSLPVVDETYLEQGAIAYVKNEYVEMGLDLEDVRNAYLKTVAIKMLIMSFLMMVASIIVGYLASIISGKVGRDLRSNIFRKVMSFSNAEINNFSTASLITRATNDIQQVQMTIVIMLRVVAYSPVLAIGGIIKVVNTNSGMGWIIVLSVAILFAVIGILMFVALPKFKIMQKLVDDLNLVSREILTGIMPIRAFSREKYEEGRFEIANNNLYSNQLFTNKVMAIMMPVMMFVMNGSSVLIVWIGSHKVDSGTIRVGDMTAFITYSMLIVMSFLMLTMVSILLPRAAVAADRIAEVLDTDPILKERDGARSFAKEECKGVLRFNHVSFAFPGAGEEVLSDIDFIAYPGKTTAIIGSTGSGKTALVNLIPRFFDVTSGNVEIDGVDVRDVSLKDLRENIGYVPQKGILFSGTIESNLKYAGEYVTDDDMKGASRVAQAEDFILEKEDGYNSHIAQEGSNVSGGQRQRLSIARAIAKHPKIYVFDDSFSALDYKTDIKLRRELAKTTTDATVIIVAQRISTILGADQIIVLEEGRIVGKGTHEELLDNCKTYYEIASSQLSEAELNKKGGM